MLRKLIIKLEMKPQSIWRKNIKNWGWMKPMSHIWTSIIFLWISFKYKYKSFKRKLMLFQLCHTIGVVYSRAASCNTLSKKNLKKIKKHFIFIWNKKKFSSKKSFIFTHNRGFSQLLLKMKILYISLRGKK